ncbi:MAG: hypothetical protein LC664_07220 [Flavobacteriales bacterium]|nr:hypothetical protein [Flavobacteriales bacterium]
MKKPGLLVIFILMMYSVAFAQDQKFNLPKKRVHEKAILGFDNKPEKEVYDIQLYADSLIYRSNGSFESYRYEKIKYIDVNDGSYAGLGAGVGAGIMLISSLFSILQVSSDPDSSLRNDAGLRVAGFTLGGAGFGALIGFAFPKRQTYYLHY